MLSRFHDAMNRKQIEGQLGSQEERARDPKVKILPVPAPAGEAQVATARENDTAIVGTGSQATVDELRPRLLEEKARDHEHWTTSDAQSPFHPAYERIIQRLLSHRRNKRENVILVASAIPGEGASTVARNLAVAIGGGQSERVILIDANLRSPCQHKAFGVARTDGLSDVVNESTRLQDAVKTGFDTDVSLMTCGSQGDSPPRLLSSSGFHSLIAALQAEFDWVVIDGPPVTAYPDAASIAAACGGAVLVLQAERTRWEVAEEAKKVLENSGVEVLGAVLNRRKYHIPWFIYKRL